MSDLIDTATELLASVHSNVVSMYRQLDSTAAESATELETTGGGITRPHVFTDGEKIEKAAALFTASSGDKLPEAASLRRQESAGKPFTAVSVSTISHPRNPHVPTSHLNLRFFNVGESDTGWYFGGGFDLTPHIPYPEDYVLWHEHARSACRDADRYRTLKRQCDEYFYLAHRHEHRGIGGLFFDDSSEGGFDECLKLCDNVGKSFVTAYSEIFRRHEGSAWTNEEEEWMLMRRGRYVEFNLLYDRGTKYGIQSGRRIESVLASLPPRVRWSYEPRPTTEHMKQISSSLADCLQPKDWLRHE